MRAITRIRTCNIGPPGMQTVLPKENWYLCGTATADLPVQIPVNDDTIYHRLIQELTAGVEDVLFQKRCNFKSCPCKQTGE